MPENDNLRRELALAGVQCRVLDRRAGQSNVTRAFAVHARTLELLDARGLAEDLVPKGVPVRQVLLRVYTLSGALAGLGGIVLASQLKSGAPTYGQMYELYVIAAVVRTLEAARAERGVQS